MTQVNSIEVLDNNQPENGSGKIKRPSLFVIKGILEKVDKTNGHRVRFQELARSTAELRNREKLIQYLNLLVSDLGWLEKKNEPQKTRWNPTKTNYHSRRWKVSWYYITDLGRSFLGLFPDHQPSVKLAEDMSCSSE